MNIKNSILVLFTLICTLSLGFSFGNHSNTTNITLLSDISETGNINIDHTGEYVTFSNSYSNPVVIANTVTNNGPYPVHVRVSNLSTSGVFLSLEEWAYQNGIHSVEEVNYLIMESGSHIIDGKRIEVGTKNVNSTSKKVTFSNTLSDPVVLTQVQTVNEADPVITRIKNVLNKSFKVNLIEEELTQTNHTTETIGYIALERGSYNSGDIFVPSVNPEIDDHEATVSVINPWTYNVTPFVFSHLQTQIGLDSSKSRILANTLFNGTSLRIEEDISKDSETNHVFEEVGLVYFR